MGTVIKEPKKRSYLITTLPFFIIAHFAHHLLTALPAPLLPFIREDFDLSYTRASLVTSSFTLANGAGQLPAGWLVNRIGTRILITIGILGVAIVGFLVGLSQTFIILLIFLVIMGLMAGGYHPAATPLISESVDPKQRGKVLGFHLIGGNAGFFVTPLIGAAIAAAWGWRSAFTGIAAISAIFGILFYFVISQRAGMSRPKVVSTSLSDEAPPPPGRRRRLVAFLALSIIGGGAGMSLLAFVPLYIVDEFGISARTAASLLAIVHSAGLWASPVGGHISDRVGRVPIILATGVISGIIVFMLKTVPYGWGFFAVLFFMGINNSFRFPVSEAFIISQTTMRDRATIYGIYYFTMQEAGAAIAPLMGYIIDNYGFYTCFNIVSATAIGMTLICSVFLWGSQD